MIDVSLPNWTLSVTNYQQMHDYPHLNRQNSDISCKDARHPPVYFSSLSHSQVGYMGWPRSCALHNPHFTILLEVELRDFRDFKTSLDSCICIVKYLNGSRCASLHISVHRAQYRFFSREWTLPTIEWCCENGGGPERHWGSLGYWSMIAMDFDEAASGNTARSSGGRYLPHLERLSLIVCKERLFRLATPRSMFTAF